MAGKKPAKVAFSERVKTVPVGSAALWISNGGSPYVCPSCSRQMKKGIIYEDKGRNACSRECLGV